MFLAMAMIPMLAIKRKGLKLDLHHLFDGCDVLKKRWKRVINSRFVYKKHQKSGLRIILRTSQVARVFDPFEFRGVK